MTIVLALVGALVLGIWLYLLSARGQFWRVDMPLDMSAPVLPDWPAVAAIVPARNEAETIAQALGSVLGQDYPGSLSVILVDDTSSDRTVEIAERTAGSSDQRSRLSVVAARPLPAGWTGKLWALSEGLAAADAGAKAPAFLWFTDADISHDRSVLRRLVATADGEDRDLVSLMVMLTCRTMWERLLIPPFVFFFSLLYPFRWVADPARTTAGAAGGCLLVRREALRRAGGLEAMRGALIDDCTLAGRIKTIPASRDRPGGGRLRLALTRLSRSIRPYPSLAGIWRMVARSAYTQLGYSPLLLVGTLAGMALAYLTPPLLVILLPLHGHAAAAGLGAAAWILMAALFLPTLRLYGQPWPMAIALPVAALFYAAMTADSARRHAAGQGGLWKGRVQAPGRGDTSCTTR